MSSALRIYLQNHEAAARAGIDLCRRAAKNQAARPHGVVLGDLLTEIREDRRQLLSIMKAAHARPNPALALVLQVGERVGRLKPNGRLVRRSPLSDLIEIEALVDAVGAKRAGWHALAASSAPVGASQIAELTSRANDQLERLQSIHAAVAARVLRG